MILHLPLILLLAQSAILPVTTSSASSKDGGSHLTGHRHHHDAPTPEPSPQVRITIVNATSVPAISLSTSGTNLPAAYPDFRQGEWTANEAIFTPEIHYLVRNSNGVAVAGQTIRFKPISSQFLLLTGDLSNTGPADKLPQVGYSPDAGFAKRSANFQFHVIPYTLVCSDPCHYRIFNAMPGKTLLLKSAAQDSKTPREFALLAPGNSILLTGQPASIDYVAEIDGQGYRVSIRQEGAEGNCLIPFFLRDGKPDFVRVFEDP